jgi:uncharacterized protein YraI
MKKLTYIVVSVVFFITTYFQAGYPVFASAQSQITRSQVEQRALAMINLKWTFTKAKNTNIDSKYAPFVTLPIQLSGIITGQMTGIPYDWGGMDGLDFNSYNEPWNNFLDAVSTGAFTGNTNSNGGEYIPHTTGIDCSGFVQAAYNIKDNKQSSSSLLNTYFKKIDLSKITHMDILNYPGVHVVIFDRWGLLNGIEGAFTYESTANQIHGGIQGTKKYFISKTTINKGYIPAKYINIIDDAPAPSAAPHPVDAQVFAKISDAVSMVNLHSSPTNSSSILCTVKAGNIIYINDYSLGWYKVSYNGETGWIWGDFIASIQKGKYVTVKNVAQLSIRKSPSSKAQVLGVLQQMQYARVLDYSSDGKWIKISINNLQGFAYASYLSYIY